MGEMRRIGTGGTVPPAAAQARLPARGGARNLAERVAQARTVAPTGRTETGAPRCRSAEAKPVDAAIGNGRNGKAQPAAAPPTPAPPAVSGDSPPAAKPLPQKCPKHPRYLRSVGGRA